MTSPRPSALSTRRRADAAAVLASAFHDDPVFGWLLPDPDSRAAALLAFFDLELHHVTPADQSLTIDAGGTTSAVALALPPGHWRTPWHVQLRQTRRLLGVFGWHLPRALRVQAALEYHHPRGPHLYLPFIGVRPGHQGRGLGTELLRPLLHRADSAGLACYLEASNPRCARLYRRLGFITTKTIRPGGAPPIELMTRPAGLTGRHR